MLRWLDFEFLTEILHVDEMTIDAARSDIVGRMTNEHNLLDARHLSICGDGCPHRPAACRRRRQ